MSTLNRTIQDIVYFLYGRDEEFEINNIENLCNFAKDVLNWFLEEGKNCYNLNCFEEGDVYLEFFKTLNSYYGDLITFRFYKTTKSEKVLKIMEQIKSLSSDERNALLEIL